MASKRRSGNRGEFFSPRAAVPLGIIVSMIAPENAHVSVPRQRWSKGQRSDGEDELVVEEPIEYQIGGAPVATVMRTPGHDRDLAIGFFFCEGWITGQEDIGSLRLCESKATENASPSPAANVLDLIPSSTASIPTVQSTRAGPVTSSCGVCGKQTIGEILASVPPLATGAPPTPKESGDEMTVQASTIAGLTEELGARQPLFVRTGALHAAGIFTLTGEVVVVREDIGRHNAVDKVIGHCVRKLGLSRDAGPQGHALMVSGRVSFEIVQKALRARIPLIVAVSGVSSLAVDLATRGGVTVCGFSRDQTFTAYTHPARIRW